MIAGRIMRAFVVYISVVVLLQCGLCRAQGFDPKKIAEYDFGESRKDLAAMEGRIREAGADSYAQIEQDLLSVLKVTGATRAAKQFVCRMIRRVGTKKSVSAMSAMLHDKDLSHMARFALQGLDSSEVDGALRSALPGAPPELKVGILGTIGARGDRKAVKDIARLAGGSDKKVAQAALAALGRIGGEKAADALAGMKVNGELRRKRDEAYLLCADSMAEEGERKAAGRIYRELFGEENAEVIRIAALRGIVKADRDAAVPVIMKLLKDKSEALQAAAGAAIVEMPSKEATRAFAKELPSMPPAAQVVMLGSLATRTDASGASDIVNNLAGSSDESVRMAAIRALSTMGDASSVAVLAKAAATRSDSGKAAFTSLSRIQAKGVDREIMKLAGSGEQAVRISMIEALASRKSGDATSVLFGLINDSDGRISSASLKALSVLVTEKDISRLIDVLVSTKSDAVRQGIESTLAAAAGRASDEKGRTGQLISGLKKADTGTRAVIMGVLGRLGGDSALAAVRSELSNKDTGVRKAAIRALGAWKDAAPMPDLLNAAKSDSDSVNKVLAFRGFANMVNLPSTRSGAATVALIGDAMKAAKRADEKKLLLGSLGNVGDLAALKMVEVYLEDGALKAEALLAYQKVAVAIKGANKAEAKAALQRVLKMTDNAAMKKSSQDALSEIDRYADYITAWLLSGPYTGGNLLNTPFAPEKDGGKNAKWKLAPVSGQGVVNLLKILSGDNRVAYLKCKVVSPSKQDARIEMGSDDGIKVWLNGKVIHNNNATRGLRAGEDKVNITLNQGENSLLVKVSQGGGDWAACARIRKRDGSALGTLSFKAQ